jgi:carbamoyltransferase
MRSDERAGEPRPDSFVLGISAYYHDSAAALVRNGEIIAAAQEERFSRKKHDPRFPAHAINYCLGEAFIDPAELSAVVFYDHPIHTIDRVFKNALSVAPSGRDQFVAACETLFGNKAEIQTDLMNLLGEVPRLLLTPHHMAHAASCFYPSPFERAAILTIDGVGEWSTCSLGFGSEDGIELIEEIRYPHSLGLLYSAFTYFCGFKVNSGEYKLMGLAPYGEPKYAQLIRDELVDIKADGSFRLNTQAFGFLESPLMTNYRFEAIFGGPPRQSEGRITRREVDLAASVQQVTEEIVLKLVARATNEAGSRNLTMAGGVALNCVANGRVLRESGLEGFFIQPAAGDAGGAIGAALMVSHEMLRVPRRANAAGDSLKGSLLGPAYAPSEVDDFVDRLEVPSEDVPCAAERAKVIAGALADGKIVGLFSGRMEFGPRALGSRSILGDPRCRDMQSRMNLKIKYREGFRPFAPAVLAELAADYFEIDGESPYMLLTAPVVASRRLSARDGVEGDADDLLAIVRKVRSEIPAVTHVDYSARVQTVGAEANPEFRRVLEAFYAQTGCPVLINTSFNVRGEPIVCSPRDAYRCFMNTGIDLLVLEDRLLWKVAQPEGAKEEGVLEYELD